MKHKFLILAALGAAMACGTVKQVPVESQSDIKVTDVTVYHDSIIYKEVPIERIVDIVPQYDTLFLETSLAMSTSYVDTTLHKLRGEIKNKEVPQEIKIKWKERIVTKDSVIVKEVPVVVEVEKVKYPKSYWYLLGFAIIMVILIGVKIYLKIKA